MRDLEDIINARLLSSAIAREWVRCMKNPRWNSLVCVSRSNKIAVVRRIIEGEIYDNSQMERPISQLFFSEVSNTEYIFANNSSLQIIVATPSQRGRVAHSMVYDVDICGDARAAVGEHRIRPYNDMWNINSRYVECEII